MDQSALQLRNALEIYKREVVKDAREQQFISYGDAKIRIESFELLIRLIHQNFVNTLKQGKNQQLESFLRQFPKPVLKTSNPKFHIYISFLEKIIIDQINLEKQSEFEKSEGKSHKEPQGALTQRLEAVKKAQIEFQRAKEEKLKQARPLLQQSLTYHQTLLSRLFPVLNQQTVIALQQQLLQIPVPKEREEILNKLLTKESDDKTRIPQEQALRRDRLLTHTLLIQNLRSQNVNQLMLLGMKPDVAMILLFSLENQLVESETAINTIIDRLINTSSIEELEKKDHIAKILVQAAQSGNVNIENPIRTAEEITEQLLPRVTSEIIPAQFYFSTFKPARYKAVKEEVIQQLKNHSHLFAGLPSDVQLERLMDIALNKSIVLAATLPDVDVKDLVNHIFAEVTAQNYVNLTSEEQKALIKIIANKLATHEAVEGTNKYVSKSTNDAIENYRRNHPKDKTVESTLQKTFPGVQSGGETFNQTLTENISSLLEQTELKRLITENKDFQEWKRKLAYETIVSTALETTLYQYGKNDILYVLEQTDQLIPFIIEEAGNIRQLKSMIYNQPGFLEKRISDLFSDPVSENLQNLVEAKKSFLHEQFNITNELLGDFAGQRSNELSEMIKGLHHLSSSFENQKANIRLPSTIMPKLKQPFFEILARLCFIPNSISGVPTGEIFGKAFSEFLRQGLQSRIPWLFPKNKFLISQSGLSSVFKYISVYLYRISLAIRTALKSGLMFFKKVSLGNTTHYISLGLGRLFNNLVSLIFPSAGKLRTFSKLTRFRSNLLEGLFSRVPLTLVSSGGLLTFVLVFVFLLLVPPIIYMITTMSSFTSEVGGGGPPFEKGIITPLDCNLLKKPEISTSCPIPNGRVTCGNYCTQAPNGCQHCVTESGYPNDATLEYCGKDWGTEYALDIAANPKDPIYLPKINNHIIEWTYVSESSYKNGAIKLFSGTDKDSGNKYLLQFHHTEPDNKIAIYPTIYPGEPIPDVPLKNETRLSGQAGAVICSEIIIKGKNICNHVHVQLASGKVGSTGKQWLDAAEYFCH